MWITAALAALNAISGIESRKKAIDNQIAANKKTATGYLTSMNYSFQNYEEQRQQMFAQAIDALSKVRFQSRRQEAQVDAAVNEEDMGGGRTADLLKRSTRNDEARAASSVVGNWQAQNDEIDKNKETVLLNTKNAIDSIPSVEKPSTLSYLMSAASTYMDTYNALDEISMRHKRVGVDTNDSRGDSNTRIYEKYGNNPITGSDAKSVINRLKIYSNPMDDPNSPLYYNAGANTNLFSSNSVFTTNPVYSYFNSSFSDSNSLSSGLRYENSYLTGESVGSKRTGSVFHTKLLL